MRDIRYERSYICYDRSYICRRDHIYVMRHHVYVMRYHIYDMRSEIEIMYMLWETIYMSTKSSMCYEKYIWHESGHICVTRRRVYACYEIIYICTHMHDARSHINDEPNRHDMRIYASYEIHMFEIWKRIYLRYEYEMNVNINWVRKQYEHEDA